LVDGGAENLLVVEIKDTNHHIYHDEDRHESVYQEKEEY
jgi:hypothetical protein